MAGIQKIGGISYNSSRVEPVTRYSKEHCSKKLKETEEEAADRAETLAYLAKYPNPDHLSFAELLDQATKNPLEADDETGYIVDIKTP